MNILFISNLYPPVVLGGYEILCARVAAVFMALGHRVTILTSDGAGVSNSGATAPGATAPGRSAPGTTEFGGTAPGESGTFPHSGRNNGTTPETGPAGEDIHRTLRLYRPFGLPPALARADRQRVEAPNRRATAALLNTLQPDAVLVWSQLRLGLAAAREAEARGLPTVYTMNDDHILGFRPGSRSGLRGLLRGLLEDHLYPASTWQGLRMEMVLAISETVRSGLAEKDSRFATARIAMQGIPLELFPLKDHPGMAHRPFRVIYAGQLHRYKGVHTLIEAAALAGSADFFLTIAGAGDPAYEAELRTLADRLSVAADFTGRVAAQAMGQLYRGSDALAFTSVWPEPFGMTHLEAMASGTPVASVDHGGPGEFLVDHQNALLFKKEDAAGLARCLRLLADDASLRTRLALAGRQTVEAEFTIERYADRLAVALSAARPRTEAARPSTAPSQTEARS
jgi:glycosyltransferase involved in cell wall biosynthesis